MGTGSGRGAACVGRGRCHRQLPRPHSGRLAWAVFFFFFFAGLVGTRARGLDLTQVGRSPVGPGASNEGAGWRKKLLSPRAGLLRPLCTGPGPGSLWRVAARVLCGPSPCSGRWPTWTLCPCARLGTKPNPRGRRDLARALGHTGRTCTDAAVPSGFVSLFCSCCVCFRRLETFWGAS